MSSSFERRHAEYGQEKHGVDKEYLGLLSLCPSPDQAIDNSGAYPVLWRFMALLEMHKTLGTHDNGQL